MSKRTILLFLMVTCLASCSEKTTSTCPSVVQMNDSGTVLSEVDIYFMRHDFDRYIGLTVNDLVKTFPVRYDDLLGLAEPPTKLIGVQYNFSGGYSISVYLADIKYTNRLSPNYKWDFSKIGEEVISGIKINHYGAPGPFCRDFGDVFVGF